MNIHQCCHNDNCRNFGVHAPGSTAVITPRTPDVLCLIAPFSSIVLAIQPFSLMPITCAFPHVLNYFYYTVTRSYTTFKMYPRDYFISHCAVYKV